MFAFMKKNLKPWKVHDIFFRYNVRSQKTVQQRRNFLFLVPSPHTHTHPEEDTLWLQATHSYSTRLKGQGQSLMQFEINWLCSSQIRRPNSSRPRKSTRLSMVGAHPSACRLKGPWLKLSFMGFGKSLKFHVKSSVCAYRKAIVFIISLKFL